MNRIVNGTKREEQIGPLCHEVLDFFQAVWTVSEMALQGAILCHFAPVRGPSNWMRL
jgi:hypothetical protein